MLEPKFHLSNSKNKDLLYNCILDKPIHSIDPWTSCSWVRSNRVEIRLSNSTIEVMLGRKKKNWVVNDFIGLINDHYLSLFCFHTPLCHAFSFTNGASITNIQGGNFWWTILNLQENKPHGFGFWISPQGPNVQAKTLTWFNK